MITIIWEIFEIAVNFYQGYLLTYFAYDFLGDKDSKKFTKSSGILYSNMLALAITILNHFMLFENFYSLIYIAIIFCYSVQRLNGRTFEKIFASVFPNLVMGVVSVLTSNFAAVLFNTDLYTILSEKNFERFIVIISTQLLLGYCLIIFLRLMRVRKKRSTLASCEWILISLTFIVSIIICTFMNMIALNDVSDSVRKYIVLMFLGIIFINIVVCYLVIDLGRKSEAMRENEILKVQQEYNRQYIKNANMEYDTIRKIRHDFKDSLNVVHTLIAEQKSDSAGKYIEGIIDTLNGTEIFIRTNNDIVNAVVNAKLSAAKSFGIDVICLSSANFDGIDDLDLCRLLSNMLENAITACMNSNSDKKQIYLKFSSDNYNYTFNLKNTIDKSVISQNPMLNTTKNNKDEHGYGTKIIKDIAEKYKGRCDFYEESGYFCCNVILRK